MYKIDLLKGTGKPPGPQYLPMAMAIIAFTCLVIAAVFGANSFSDNREQMATLTQMSVDLENQQQTHDVAEDFLQQTDLKRQNIHARLDEINQALNHEIQWSPILTAIVENIPEDVILYNINIKREPIGVKPEDIKYEYFLVLGLLTSEDPLSLEHFMDTLGKLETLKPELQEFRVANQSQQNVRDYEFLYIVIECKFEPY